MKAGKTALRGVVLTVAAPVLVVGALIAAGPCPKGDLSLVSRVFVGGLGSGVAGLLLIAIAAGIHVQDRRRGPAGPRKVRRTGRI